MKNYIEKKIGALICGDYTPDGMQPKGYLDLITVYDVSQDQLYNLTLRFPELRRAITCKIFIF